MMCGVSEKMQGHASSIMGVELMCLHACKALHVGFKSPRATSSHRRPALHGGSGNVGVALMCWATKQHFNVYNLATQLACKQPIDKMVTPMGQVIAQPLGM